MITPATLIPDSVKNAATRPFAMRESVHASVTCAAYFAEASSSVIFVEAEQWWSPMLALHL
jgi:hypothetical protein